MRELAKIDLGLPALTSAITALEKCKTVKEAKQVIDVAATATEYAKRAQLGKDAVAHATEIKVRAERRAGQLLRELRKATPKERGAKGARAKSVPDSSSFRAERTTEYQEALAESGMGDDAGQVRASKWQALARIPEADFEAAIEATKQDSEITTTAVKRKATATSESGDYDGDEWYTPRRYIDAAIDVLGGIDLDPASSLAAQKTVSASKIFTKDDDGLSREWHGRIFLNPPYSLPLIHQFTEKFIGEYEAERIDAGIVLVNNCTDTGWFHALLSRFSACFTLGRIAFEAPGRAKFATRQGQAFFYAGADVHKFMKVFSNIGIVLGKIA
jgi:phage N-6-adenine-methyltransferase